MSSDFTFTIVQVLHESETLLLILTSLTTFYLFPCSQRSQRLHLQTTVVITTALTDSQVTKIVLTIQRTQNQSAHQVQQIDVVDLDEAVPKNLAEAHMIVSAPLRQTLLHPSLHPLLRRKTQTCQLVLSVFRLMHTLLKPTRTTLDNTLRAAMHSSNFTTTLLIRRTHQL